MNTSSRYRILWPRPDDKRPEIKEVSHWIFSMNGSDWMVFYLNGNSGRGFSLRPEFPPQWKFVNDKLDRNEIKIIRLLQ